MPADKLFWNDPYLDVVRCDRHLSGGRRVTVDRTVFFAFSGGQASDTGTIGGRPVLSARTDGLEIVYTLERRTRLAVGDSVRVEIDWPTRYRIMRLHFAAELVLELVYQGHGHPEKVGANITAEKARVDFAWDGSIAPVLPEVARPRSRELVEADLPIDECASRTRRPSVATGASTASHGCRAAARIFGGRRGGTCATQAREPGQRHRANRDHAR